MDCCWCLSCGRGWGSVYETTITSKPASIIMLRKQLLPVQMENGKIPEWSAYSAKECNPLRSYWKTLYYKNFNVKDLKSKESSVSMCVQLLNHVQLFGTTWTAICSMQHMEYCVLAHRNSVGSHVLKTRKALHLEFAQILSYNWL